MTATAPHSLSAFVLDNHAVTSTRNEAPSDMKEVMTDTSVERDCLCGTFNADDRLFVMPGKVIKSRW
ncbi:hypothetical protein [Rhodanobacter sp. C05]|uniref:hypothetical protein n=1 Tax=Rhodanobacter sp. C05 TaxID=1945855 RepID=UPI000984FF51|nr:hypothetical protein [Rhodanobacter sp. C05]OOG37368.1 hypothetical protein B0E51_16030 [Rhodanobacter sp. C05]